MTSPPTQPTLQDVEGRLKALIAGTVTREEVSRWARPWIAEDMPQLSIPKAVWDALERLGAADLRASPDDYLYTEPDFHAWLDDVQNAMDDRG